MCYTYESEYYRNKYLIKFRTNTKSSQYKDTIQEFSSKYVYFISKQLLGESFYSNKSKIIFNNDNYVFIIIYSNLTQSSLENKINREYNIKPYELDDYRKEVITDYPTLHLTRFVDARKLNETDELEEFEELENLEEVDGEELQESEVTKNVLIQFQNPTCKIQKDKCLNNFNDNKLNYQIEINRLLKKSRNSIKSIEIIGKCGMIDEEGKAVLKIKIIFNSSDNFLSKLSNLVTDRVSGIKPKQNECEYLNNCYTIKFLDTEATPLLNTFKELGEDEININFKTLFKKINTHFNKADILNKLSNLIDQESIEINDFNKNANKIILFIINNKNILSYESLRKILKYVIFKQLRETDGDKLQPKLEELRKIAIIKLNFINYKLIEKFISDTSLNISDINSNTLYKQWKNNKYKIISREIIMNLVGENNNITFWFKTRETIINDIIKLLNASQQDNKIKKTIILFLIFGDYGIQPAMYLHRN